MHMYMKNGLPTSLIHINPNIITIRIKSLINLTLHILQHNIHSLTLTISKIKIISYMSFGDNQSMTR